jgi:putative MFS transporter
VLLILGGLGGLLSWYFRRRLPESPRWLAVAGRSDEAAEALAQIEQAVEQDTGRQLPPVTVPAAPAAPAMPFRMLLQHPYLGRTVLLTAFQLLQTVGYYGFMHWLPTLLRAKHFDYDRALTLQIFPLVLAPVGPLLAVWSIERWQRKWLIVGLALTLAAAQAVFGLAGEEGLLVAAGLVIVVGSNWFSAVFHAYQAELFPTAARATGVGFTYAWSRASMIALSLVMPWLIAESLAAAFGVMVAAFAGVALLIGVFGPRTNARALEEIAA